MLVLDGHKSHISIAFKAYCKEKNIVTLYLPAHSSHITQPLNIRYFSILKQLYSQEIEDFIKASITHITKLKFFHTFKAAHNKTMILRNIQASFQGSSLVPFDPKAVISKLNIKLQTPTPTGPPPSLDPWVS